MKIGIAGLGRMGSAIAKRLKDVGHDITVWNRSPEKMTPLVQDGANPAKSPAELAQNVDVIITIVTDVPAIENVYSGTDGLLSGDVRGKLFIEMSTVRPETEVALAEKIRAKGASMVECPVGGTVGPALQGKLIGLAGGEAADVERARPILSLIHI